MDWNFILFATLKILGVLFLALLPMVAYSVLAERKISAFIQDRQGPNRVSFPLLGSIPILGPFLTKLGVWQPLADAVKSIFKEDFTPSYVRKAYFWMAPAITMIPAFMTIGVIPFGSNLGADIDEGAAPCGCLQVGRKGANSQCVRLIGHDVCHPLESE